MLFLEFSVATDGSGQSWLIEHIYDDHYYSAAPMWKHLFTRRWIQVEDGSIWKLKNPIE